MNKNTYKAYIDSYDYETSLFYSKDLVENSKAIIIFVHGVTEHIGMYDEITKYYNEKGYTIYRYDQRGHGRTKGEKGFVKDWKDLIWDLDKFIKKIKLENPHKPIFIVGFSMGGFVAVNYAIINKCQVDGLVLIAPFTLGNIPGIEKFVKATFLADSILANKFYKEHSNIRDLEKLVKIFEGREHFKVPITSTMRDFYVKKLVKNENIDNFFNDPYILKSATASLAIEALKGVKFLCDKLDKIDYPTFILQGQRDLLVDKRDSKKLFEEISSKDKKINFYDTSHTVLIDDKSSWDDIINWIDALLENEENCEYKYNTSRKD